MPGHLQDEIRISKPMSPALETLLNVNRTARFLTAWTEKVLEPVELRIDEYNVMRILRGAGAQGHARHDIEERMVHEPDRLLAILHRLRTRGLIEGTIRHAITAQGLATLASIDADLDRAIEERIGWIDADSLRTTISVLERIRSGPEGEE